MDPTCIPEIISLYGFHVHVKFFNRFDQNYRILFTAFIYIISILKLKILLVGLEAPFICCHMFSNSTVQCLSWACNSLLATPKLPCVIWKVRINYHIYMSLHVVSTLSQIKPVHIIKCISVISSVLLSTHLHLNVQVSSSYRLKKPTCRL
jgi:hypothetical protein